MRAMYARLCLGAALLLAAAAPVSAHHSFAAEYDSSAPISVTGVVTKIEWTNPHAYVYVDVKDDSGKVTNWAFEMGPPHMLQKSGWKKNELKLGEVLEVDGWLARDGGNSGNTRRVTRKATGQVLGGASSVGQTTTGNAGSAEATP